MIKQNDMLSLLTWTIYMPILMTLTDLSDLVTNTSGVFPLIAGPKLFLMDLHFFY